MAIAKVWLEDGGTIGGRLQEQPRKLRLEIRDRMYGNAEFVARAIEEVRTDTPMSKVLIELWQIVKQVYPKSEPDPYCVEQRNKYALRHDLYHKITGFDVFIALDHFRRVLGM